MTDPWKATHFKNGYTGEKREWKRRAPICTIEGCGKPHEAKGLCRGHYLRQLRHGDPLAGCTAHHAGLEWLESIREYDGEECRMWPFEVSEGHYGRVTIEGKRVGAHHLMCIWTHGDRPSEDFETAHSCGNRLCCNPRHLRWATPAGNSADRLTHGTDARGEKSPTAKLTAQQVRLIRRLRGVVTQRDLAILTGVYFNHISKIHRGEIWIGEEYAG